MPSFSVRPARPEDVASLRAVVRAAYAPWMGKLDGLPDVADGLETDIAKHDVRVAIRTDDGALLGGIVLALSETAHVVNLAVSPASAGQGIGRALLATAENVALAAGFGEMNLATHKDMIPTLGFYERNGWTVTEREGVRCFLTKKIG